MTTATHTLVSLEAITGDELARIKSYPENRSAFYGRNVGSGCGRVVPGSALVVPPPPDYSTPAAVSARCWEGGPRASDDLRAAGKDAGFRRAYRELRKLLPALIGTRASAAPCRVEDTHISRWAIVDRNAPHSAYTDSAPDFVLIPAADAKPATTIRPRRRHVAAAA